MTKRVYKQYENRECIAFAEYLKEHGIPFMRIACEIPTKSFGVLASLRRQGFQSGYPDFYIYAPSDPYHALAVEMKKVGGAYPVQTGKDLQDTILKSMAMENVATFVTMGAEVAIKVTETYFNEPYKLGNVYAVQEGVRKPKQIGRFYNLLVRS